MAFFHQGKPLPKTEQKFENFVKSSFKISDKKVSNHESLDILCVCIYLLIGHGFESPDYEASEIGLCLFLSLNFLHFQLLHHTCNLYQFPAFLLLQYMRLGS